VILVEKSWNSICEELQRWYKEIRVNKELLLLPETSETLNAIEVYNTVILGGGVYEI